jgi:hypothetical protein
MFAEVTVAALAMSRLAIPDPIPDVLQNTRSHVEDSGRE